MIFVGNADITIQQSYYLCFSSFKFRHLCKKYQLIQNFVIQGHIPLSSQWEHWAGNSEKMSIFIAAVLLFSVCMFVACTCRALSHVSGFFKFCYRSSSIYVCPVYICTHLHCHFLTQEPSKNYWHWHPYCIQFRVVPAPSQDLITAFSAILCHFCSLFLMCCQHKQKHFYWEYATLNS